MKTFETQKEQPNDLKFDRLPQTLALVGLRKTQLYALMAKGEFPQPIRIGARTVAWVHSEVQAWMQARIADAKSQRDLEAKK